MPPRHRRFGILRRKLSAELQERTFVLHMVGVPGTSLSESMRAGTEVTRALLQNSHVESVAQESAAPSSAKIRYDLTKANSKSSIARKVRVPTFLLSQWESKFHDSCSRRPD